jgi:hypothetical protein
MNKFNIGENIFFIWNFKSYPGIIRDKKNKNVYIVEFSQDIDIGRINNLHHIHECFLKSNDNLKVNNKIIIKI